MTTQTVICIEGTDFMAYCEGNLSELKEVRYFSIKSAQWRLKDYPTEYCTLPDFNVNQVIVSPNVEFDRMADTLTYCIIVHPDSVLYDHIDDYYLDSYGLELKKENKEENKDDVIILDPPKSIRINFKYQVDDNDFEL